MTSQHWLPHAFAPLTPARPLRFSRFPGRCPLLGVQALLSPFLPLQMKSKGMGRGGTVMRGRLGPVCVGENYFKAQVTTELDVALVFPPRSEHTQQTHTQAEQRPPGHSPLGLPRCALPKALPGLSAPRGPSCPSDSAPRATTRSQRQNCSHRLNTRSAPDTDGSSPCFIQAGPPRGPSRWPLPSRVPLEDTGS